MIENYDGVYEVEACNKCKHKSLDIEDSFLGSSQLKTVQVKCMTCYHVGPMYVIRPQEKKLNAMNKAIVLWNKKDHPA